VIDAGPIRAAAADVVELWPDSEDRVSPGGGSWAVHSMHAQAERPAPARELEIESERRTQLIDITDQVRAAVRGSRSAAVVVFVAHTTAGVVLQAAGPEATKVAADVESALERIVDPGWPWEHLEEGDRNPWSHARAALTASSVTIPLDDGELALGSLQRVFFCELDGPRRRRVRLQLL
jgi:secondary thiamine-phosphate synthase enzyme